MCKWLHMYRLPTPPCPQNCRRTVLFAFSNLFRQDSDSKQPEDLPPRTMDLVSGGLAHYLCVAHVGSLPVFASTKVFGCRLVIRAGAATYWQPCYTLSSDYFPICSYFHIFYPIRTVWISWAPATQLTHMAMKSAPSPSLSAAAVFPALRSARGADDSRPRAPGKPQAQCWRMAAG